MEKMSKQEYGNLTKKASPNTESWISIPWAFMVGGLICTLGQGLINLWEYMGLSEEMAPTAASVTLVLLSALTTGLNVYDKLANKAGAGTLVPITGFANAVAFPALEFKSEGLITGMAAKMFTVAGPIIVFGVLSGTIVGLIYYFL